MFLKAQLGFVKGQQKMSFIVVCYIVIVMS